MIAGGTAVVLATLAIAKLVPAPPGKTVTLAKLPPNSLLSLRQVSSCGTATAASLPCMFAPQGRADFDADKPQENLLDGSTVTSTDDDC